MKPIIGITNLIDYQRRSYWMLPGYMQMIQAAGGIPVILPFTRDQAEIETVLDHIDGILLTGGQDIEPAIYGELQLDYCGETSDLRDDFERLLIKIALKRDLPMFGICRGIQILNVALGGTLYQDLAHQHPSTINHHMLPPYNRVAHQVKLSSHLKDLYNKNEIGVNSYHHQAIKDLGKGLSIMAVSEDGLIEAVSLDSHSFVWAVQWHPEYLFRKDEQALLLTKTFIDACIKKVDQR